MMNRVVLARKITVYWLSMLLVIGSFSSLGLAQTSTTSRILGTVTDPQGAVVPTAEVVIKSNDTGVDYKLKVGEDGTFGIASLPVGTYTISVTAQGFKQTVLQNVRTEIGTPATVEVKLEVGAANEIVTVTSGAEVLQKDSTNVGTVISGRQITELPFASRDALDLVLTMPGTASPGRPRSSSINGLPKGAISISTDGINVQDNTLRSTDGFFTYIRPRIDAIEEVQVSMATPGAEASAGGAVHIRFVTKGGTNEYHGGAYWQNRQRAYNSNYYFSNLTGVERAQVMLNQFGVKVGGPITPWLKDRAFFFVNYEEYRLPEQQTRNRIILSPDAARGIFRYPGGPAAGVNLLGLSALCPGTTTCPGTIDPIIGKILSDMRSSTSKGSVRDQTDPNFQQLTFTNTGGQTRRFPTLRFDVNVTNNHHVEAVYNYQDFASVVDFLNGVDPAFPDPLPQILGSQGSNRFSFSTALRSQLRSDIVNEARFGLTGGTVVFFPEVGAASFDSFGGVAPVFPGNLANPFSVNQNQRRNAPIQQFSDNLSWTRGRHNLNFGGDFNRASSFSQNSRGALVPQLTFDVVTADPATALFSAANFPNITADQLTNARGIYALLTGRVSDININAKLDEITKQYSLAGSAIDRSLAKSFGFYFQDYFKVSQNFTLNYGLRWQPQLAPVHTNNVFVRPTFAGLFGPSGPGNMFRPGAIGGTTTTYIPVDETTKPFENDMNNFGPSIGFAWSPQTNNRWLKMLFGEGDRSVIRAAYAISYVTGGFGDFTGVWNNNPGAARFAGLRVGTGFGAGTVLLRNGIPALSAGPALTFPVASAAGIRADDFDPNLKTPYVQSWTLGLQRELTKDTALEIRYVANHSIGLVRTYNLNEVNIFENGFLQEFINAQNNLAIHTRANCGTTGNPACSFGNSGLAGQVAVPLLATSFGGATSASFTNATFRNLVLQGQAGALANQIGNSTGNIAMHNRRIAAGLPANLFIVNPSVLGANSQLQANGGSSTYNSLQVEVRRRFSSGLLMQGSYVWSHALANASLHGLHTLRSDSMDKGPSAFDLRHAFKLNYIYELPIGPGRRFDYSGAGGVVGKILEGWQTDGIIRWQSGRVFGLNSGRATVNQFESGVTLVGMDANELQRLVQIRKDPLASTRGQVFWLPDDIIDNSLKAFGLKPGAPTGRYIAPPSTPGKFGSFIYLYGPSFFRADLSMVKKTRITERTNVEFRAEFLNAFNNINFLVGGNSAAEGPTLTVASLANFGQTNQAYQDVSTTNDPGGRLIQFVLRFNF
jgi:hypothetical protein